MSKEDAQSFLEHHGVKGMHWGVRRQAKLDRLTRVGNGTGSKADKVNATLLNLSSNDIRRNGGIQAAAKAKAEFMQQRHDRIASGKAKVTDHLGNIGDIRLRELVRPVKRSTKETTPKKSHISDKDMANIQSGEKDFQKFLKDNRAYRVDILGRPKLNSKGKKIYV